MSIELHSRSTIHCIKFGEVLKLKIKWLCHSVSPVKRVRSDCRSPLESLKKGKVWSVSVSFVVSQIELDPRSAFCLSHVIFTDGKQASSLTTEQVRITKRKCFCWFVIAISNIFCNKYRRLGKFVNLWLSEVALRRVHELSSVKCD